MEEGELFDQYDFSEPWDSPHNIKLLGKIPDAYRCPKIDESSAQGRTPFLAVVGTDVAWSETGSRRREDFVDGLQDTVLVLELPGRAVPWTQPVDVRPPLTTGGQREVRALADGSVVNALFGDGSVWGLKRDLLGGHLRAAFTLSGGGVFDRRFLGSAVDHVNANEFRYPCPDPANLE
jgi:hypothetical protein